MKEPLIIIGIAATAYFIVMILAIISIAFPKKCKFPVVMDGYYCGCCGKELEE